MRKYIHQACLTALLLSLPLLALSHSLHAQAQISLSSNKVSPGQAILVTFTMKDHNKGLGKIVAHIDAKTYPFFRHQDASKYYALIPFSYHATLGEHKLLVRWREKRTPHAQTFDLYVVAGKYPSSQLSVDPKRVRLNAADQLRVEKERTLIAAIFDKPLSDTPLWVKDFKKPLGSIITSPYGVRRVFNGSLKSYHSGVDFRAATGTSIRAANAGIVRFAGNLFYAGNIVVLGHGAGIFTAYAHLSRIDVQVNQKVERGQILGRSGATGRVSGPHLHWSFRVAGARPDPMQIYPLLNQIK